MMSHNHRNFWIANIINALFLSGYVILKFPLAFILTQEGISIHQAYSLTTTSTIVFALCSLLLTHVLKKYHNQKHLFLLGIIFNLIAIILLEIGRYYFIIAGLTFYVLGGSLYFFNITLLLNKQFHNPRERLHGNYTAQICLNIGAFVGIALFLFCIASYHGYFFSGIVFMGTALVLLVLCYSLLKDNVSTQHQNYHLYAQCIGILFVIALCLQFNTYTRWLVLFSFSIAILSILYRAHKHHDHHYFAFILLVLFFSLPYWIGNVILYNQFFIFLHNRVSPFFGIPATTVILFDPIGNIIFGLLWIRLTRNRHPTPYTNLQFGLLLIALAFAILTVSVYWHPNKISIYIPILTILLFSFAQFLIQPTLHSRVNDLIVNHQTMIFALGVLRAIRAFAAIIAFYLMNESIHTLQKTSLYQNAFLYLRMMLIALLAWIIFMAIKHKVVINEKAC